MKFPRLKFALSTYFWITFIFSSSFFMRQVLRVFVTFFGKGVVSAIIWMLFLLLAFLLGRILIAQKRNNTIFLLVFFVGIGLAAFMPIPEERVHIVKFGFLGWLVCRDLHSSLGVKAMLVSLLTGFAVSSIDETIQFFLPYRVGDMRDVFFGTLGGACGGLLFLAACFQQSGPAAKETK